MAGSVAFDPQNVNLDTASPAAIICYLNAGTNDYDGRLGPRISAIFVILIVSTATTFFPVAAARIRWLRIPIYVYLFARYFGAGVIIATAFIHLLDPAYSEIGPQSCVGMTGNWASYSWPPAIAMTSVMLIFLLDFAAEWYVESKYGLTHAHDDVEGTVTDGGATSAEENEAHRSRSPSTLLGELSKSGGGHPDKHNAGVVHASSHTHQYLHSADQDSTSPNVASGPPAQQRVGNDEVSAGGDSSDVEKGPTSSIERAFYSQIAAFLILEFGVIFHSVIIGLNLGVVGAEFSVLYPVIVFHQSFEGLGIGARLSAIPFPRSWSWLPWLLCAAYGLTTPISISIGLGLSTSYDSGSFTANLVSGVLDAMSAGILIYTGLVELLARDFLFNPERSRDKVRVVFMLVCLFLGMALMALLGKWA